MLQASYDGIPTDKKIFFLLVLARNQELPEELRQLCAVLLRRLFTTHFEFAWGQVRSFGYLVDGELNWF